MTGINQLDLFGIRDTRKHDLPPLWDGRAVWWQGWQAPHPDPVFVCTSSRKLATYCCPMCGSQRQPATNRGHVARTTATSRERWLQRCEAWNHLPMMQRHKLPRYPSGVLELVAHRCPDCHSDEVWHIMTDTWWTLDESDYSDAGSVDPTAEHTPW